MQLVNAVCLQSSNAPKRTHSSNAPKHNHISNALKHKDSSKASKHKDSINAPKHKDSSNRTVTRCTTKPANLCNTKQSIMCKQGMCKQGMTRGANQRFTVGGRRCIASVPAVQQRGADAQSPRRHACRARTRPMRRRTRRTRPMRRHEVEDTCAADAP